MAPKPIAAKPTGSGKKAASKKGGDAKTPAADAAADDVPASMAAPKNKEEVLAQVNLDGLPNCPAEQIITILRSKYETLVQVFIHYCKFSECATIESSTRLHLGACDDAPHISSCAAGAGHALAATQWALAPTSSLLHALPPPPLAPGPVLTPDYESLDRLQMVSRGWWPTPSWRCPCTTSS